MNETETGKTLQWEDAWSRPEPWGVGEEGSEEDLLFACLGLKGNSEQRRDSLGVQTTKSQPGVGSI